MSRIFLGKSSKISVSSAAYVIRTLRSASAFVSASCVRYNTNSAKNDTATRIPQQHPQGSLPPVVFVIGGPGSGKGTQSSLLASLYNFRHISVGELLRDEQASGSEDGKVVASILGEGRIVPVKMSLHLLRAAMLTTPLGFSASATAASKGGDRANGASTLGYSGFLIDGFPRNADNVQGWEEAGMAEVCQVRGCLYLDCSVSALKERLLLRGKKAALSSGSGSSSGSSSSSGGSGSGWRDLPRADDAAETVDKRLRVYEGITLPVIEHFARKGILWTVDGNQSVESVTQAAMKILDSNLK